MITRPLLVLILALSSLCIFLTPNIGSAGQVTLAWDMNNEPNVTGYKIYYGKASRNYDWFIDVGNVTQVTITDLPNGATYYFAATAYDNSNPPTESTYSDEVNKDMCTYSISQTNASFSASGGTGSVSVTTQPGCAWTASSSASWLTITSGKNGTGSGAISYSVSANTNTDTRTASSTFAGKVFTVSQSGATTYKITASAGAGGTISPSENISVPNGGSQTFTILPDAGHAISDILIDGSSVGAVSSYTFRNVTADHTIYALFVPGYTLSITTSGTGSGHVVAHPLATVYAPGTKITLKAIAGEGSNFGGFSGDCENKRSRCIMIINQHSEINAAFELKNFKLIATAIGNGSISVEGAASIKNKKIKHGAKIKRIKQAITVSYGSQLVYHINPEPEHYIKKVIVNGKPIEAVDTLTFADIKRNHRVKVKFESQAKFIQEPLKKIITKQAVLQQDAQDRDLSGAQNFDSYDTGDDKSILPLSYSDQYASLQQ